MERPSADEIQRIRVAFFRKTRGIALALYVLFAVAAAAAGGYALSVSAVPALVAAFVAVAVTVLLIALGTRVRISPRTTRMLIVAGTIAGVVCLPLLGSGALFWGAMAGACAGCVGGITYSRWRLARDDDLILRQREAGFDPERPFGWLRG